MRAVFFKPLVPMQSETAKQSIASPKAIKKIAQISISSPGYPEHAL
jgi:hypothetical protein